MANDLDAVLVLVLGTVAAFAALLFLLAYLEPEAEVSATDLVAPPRDSPVPMAEVVALPGQAA